MPDPDAPAVAATLDSVVATIARGGVAAIPTDTVYGLACDPANTAAVERVYAIKRRPPGLELTLLAPTLDEVEAAVELDAAARRLAQRHWPGPLSIVAPLGQRRLSIPRHGATLSTRIPDHALLLELLRRTGPLASTSANRHGERPAASAQAVRDALGEDVDAVLDGGPAGGIASTIIDCSCTPPRLLRAGPIPLAELLIAAGPPESPDRLQRRRNDAE